MIIAKTNTSMLHFIFNLPTINIILKKGQISSKYSTTVRLISLNYPIVLKSKFILFLRIFTTANTQAKNYIQYSQLCKCKNHYNQKFFNENIIHRTVNSMARLFRRAPRINRSIVESTDCRDISSSTRI